MDGRATIETCDVGERAGLVKLGDVRVAFDIVVRLFARHNKVDDAAEQEDVVGRLRRLAERPAGHQIALAGTDLVGYAVGAAASKVGDAHIHVGAEQDVARREVGVDDVVRVEGLEAAGDLQGPATAKRRLDLGRFLLVISRGLKPVM